MVRDIYSSAATLAVNGAFHALEGKEFYYRGGELGKEGKYVFDRITPDFHFIFYKKGTQQQIKISNMSDLRALFIRANKLEKTASAQR